MAIFGFAMIVAFSSVPGLGQQPQPAVLQLPLPLDLIADQGLDPNGLPLNPQWGYQVTSQGVVRELVESCIDFHRYTLPFCRGPGKDSGWRKVKATHGFEP
jgi:hypothetical protein